MAQVVIEGDSLTKHFGSLVAVEDLSFQVKEGEFFSFLGPSGCGKTTTLRMVAGFESITGGEMLINGETQTHVPPNKRDVSMVFQNYALFPHKSVGENVAFGLKMEGVPKEERQARVAEYLNLVDLGGFKDRNPTELSGGQQQRVALARALVTEPSVLLLDEPLANLDLKLRKQMRFELQRIQSELDITTIYVTHDQEEALSMSDRLLVMNEGKRQQTGIPVHLYEDPANEFVADFIGDTNLLTGTVTSIDDQGAQVELDTISTATFTLPGEEVPERISKNDEIIVSVRPEDINVNAKTDGKTGIIGRVETKTFLGKISQMMVDIGEEELLVETAGRRANRQFSNGQEVVLNWEPDEISLIPA